MSDRRVVSEDPYTVEKDGKQYYGRADRKVCAGCGHHKSVHQYRPLGPFPGPEGPRDCRNCSCQEYLQPARYERIIKAWQPT
jgi:hypothetical protein